jgi:hypothetical protein
MASKGERLYWDFGKRIMPKDYWLRARDRDHARRAKQEFAEFGHCRSYELLSDDFHPREKSTEEPKIAEDDRIISWLNLLRREAEKKEIWVPAFTEPPSSGDSRIITLLPFALRNDAPENLQMLGNVVRRTGRIAVRSLSQFLAASDEVVACSAARAIGFSGKCALDAVPELEKAASSLSLKVRACAKSVLRSINGYRHERSILGKAQHGDHSRAANPVPQFSEELLDALTSADPAICLRAKKNLATNGKKIVPFLAKRLAEGNLRQQRGSAIGLQYLREDALPAFPQLTIAAKSSDIVVRGCAEKAVTVLFAPFHLDRLVTGNAAQRLNSVIALKRHVGGRSLIPRLIVLLQHSDRNIRAAAVEILKSLGPSAAEALPALKKASRRSGKRFRLAVSVAIKKIKGPARLGGGTSSPSGQS